VEVVLAYLEQARRRLATAERGEEMLADLAAGEEQARTELAAAAQAMSAQRRTAIAALSKAVERELKDLNLGNARFDVAIAQQPDVDGVESSTDGQATRVAVDATGTDRVEFLFSANPGQPPRSLGRIASGGELARVALALKAVLARVDQRTTLIFDEIDVGVGGRSASVVGQKLWALTDSHQVLCVTHMPQVAAFADQHLVVSKGVSAGVARTRIDEVDGEQRVAELAAMLGGDPGSKAATANARELLQRSQQQKATAVPVARAPRA
jgi:DNA repair protein RecN (Recombination protein N)